jgi:hypothetical protein
MRRTCGHFYCAMTEHTGRKCRPAGMQAKTRRLRTVVLSLQGRGLSLPQETQLGNFTAGEFR